MELSSELMGIDIEYSTVKIPMIFNSRSLKSSCTVEIHPDFHTSYSSRENFDDFYKDFYGEAEYHKMQKERWLDKYIHRIKSMKGIEKINMQHKINSLKNEIKNHDKYFAEYYL